MLKGILARRSSEELQRGAELRGLRELCIGLVDHHEAPRRDGVEQVGQLGPGESGAPPEDDLTDRDAIGIGEAGSQDRSVDVGVTVHSCRSPDDGVTDRGQRRKRGLVGIATSGRLSSGVDHWPAIRPALVMVKVDPLTSSGRR